MRKIALVIFLSLVTNVLFAMEIITLPEIMKPDIIKVDDQGMVIAEGGSISIFSPENYKRIKKFGKTGEGPREFKIFMGFGMVIDLYPEYIFVQSIGKISYYTRKGEFIKERKIDMMNRMTPFREKFVGTGMQFGQNSRGPKMAFNLYNGKGEKIKEICSHKLPMIRGKGNIALYDLLSPSQINPQYQTSEDRVFIAGKEAFEIDIYDQQGIFLESITRDYKKQKLTADDKNKLLEAYKEAPLYKPFWERIKSAIEIPDYFAYFKTFLVSDQNLYVQTNKKEEGKTEFLIFDLDGKYIKTSFLPLVYQDIVTPYLYTIHGGRVYQLVENEDEEWELRISNIK